MEAFCKFILKSPMKLSTESGQLGFYEFV